MKTFALAVAAVGVLALAVPTFADAQTSTSVGVRADVGTPSVKKKVIIRHDNGLHRGFAHSRHLGYAQASKKVVIKKPGKTIIKKKYD